MKDKFDFNNPEDFRRAEVLVYNGTLDWSDFPPPEYKYFSELRKVYQAFKSGELPRELAECRKKTLFINYRKCFEDYTYYKEVWKKYQKNIKISEMLMTKIQKSHDVQEIAETAVRAVGLMTHDETFIKTNLTKLEALK